jgi:hypothetical protein
MFVLAIQDGQETIVNSQFVMELTPQIHLFVSQEETVLNQTTAHAIHSTMDPIVNTLFAMEFQINLDQFAQVMEIVFLQTIAIVLPVTMEIIVNFLFVTEFLPMKALLAQVTSEDLVYHQIIALAKLVSVDHNAKITFVTELTQQTQEFAQETEIVPHQTIVSVNLHIMEISVNFLIFMTLFNLFVINRMDVHLT